MEEYKKAVLDVYFDEKKDFGRFSSQDICDNLRDTVSLEPNEVTEYLMSKGTFTLMRIDDRLVWVKM